MAQVQSLVRELRSCKPCSAAKLLWEFSFDGPWSDTTERLHFHFSLSCIGEGNGNPLQCSCLENPRNGGAWWAAVCGVAQSRTRLKQPSSSSSTWKQPRCPSTDEWVKELWYVCTVAYYSAIKRNTFDSVLMRWLNLKPVTQGKSVRKRK